MVRKIYRKKSVAPKGGRRRLGGRGSGPRPTAASIARAAARAAIPRAVQAVGRIRAYATGKRYYTNAQKAKMRSQDVSVGDNISYLPPTVVGKPRKPSFAEKVARVERPPLLFKRNFQFSAEGISGRKAWFGIPLNHNTNDFYADVSSYKINLTTDTPTDDKQILSSYAYDKARFYIDYMSCKLQFMNSGSNALSGKIHIFAYKRDSKAHYTNSLETVPVTPINMMMFYSTYGKPVTGATNYENVVGNGWNFDATTANSNYTANYNMPGSSVNGTGVCAFTDLALSPQSTHVKTDMGFWFVPIQSQSFSLKPGQQVNKIIKFHDLATLAREQFEYEYFNNISYHAAVEFNGQVVGAIDTANLVSTGSSQLSVIREDVRILGLKNSIHSKVMLQTAPLTTIIKANQVIINPDTGVQSSGGYVDDN